MECNKEDALRAKEITEKKMQSKDFVGAHKFAIKAQRLYPDLENLSQMLMICEVQCAAEQKLFGTERDWYGILQVAQTADDPAIKKKYRKFALQLHPDKNKFPGAEEAFKLIGEAQTVLLDRDKRNFYDLKRKASVSKMNVPYQPPQKASWSSNVGGQNNVRGNYSDVPSQQQQQPFPPGYSDGCSTFWTACPFCTAIYQYHREILNGSLICERCQKPFIAFDVNIPGEPPQTKSSQQESPPKNVGVRKSEVRFQGNVRAEKYKAESFQKTGQKAGSSSGISTVKVTHKRGKRHVVESSESSDSDVIIDDFLQAGLKSGCFGMQQTRRSSRHKEQVSYKENLTDDEGTPAWKSKKRSGSACATEEDSEAYKEEASKMKNAKGDEEMVKVCESKKRSKTSEKVGAEEFGCGKNSEAHETQEPDPSHSVPDIDFKDFQKDREGGCFEPGQLWAVYDSRTGMPNFYAVIKKVHSTSAEFKVQITWLERDPDDNESKWAAADLPFSCGKFTLGKSETRKDRLIFSHLMSCEKIKSCYKIYPKKGETWAIFKNWDINWCSGLDTNQKRKFEYEFVHILSEYAEGVGIWVAPLDKVKGFVRVFCQRVKDEKGTYQVLPGEFLRFSHKVPSCILTGDERVGVPSGSVVFDPASLPDNLESIDILEAEFYNFDAGKSLEKFEIGQIWALYCDDECLPKYYGQIKSIDSLRMKVRVAWLFYESLPGNVLGWHDKEMPFCCGRYRFGVGRGSFQDYGSDSLLAFSHRIEAEAFPCTGRKNEYEIYPKKGEVWALYKNWTSNISRSDLPTCEYDPVVVFDEIGLQREVLILERVDGYKSVFRTRLKGGSPDILTIPGVEILRFSHNVPYYRPTEEKGGSLRDCWELDTAALPVSFFSET